MVTSAECLGRLGLEEGADERQVRRAYARELKLIDQERDLEGFQHLRTCYEMALAWIAHRVAHAEPAPAQAQGDEPVAQADAAAPAEAEQQVNPVVLADGVFADFRARMAALAAQPERMGREESALVAPWTAALRDALADPRLLHLYARVIFEHRTAALLADGWQPGHHLLLPAAVEVFGWDHDRHALERLGRAGGFIDEALEQHAMFLSQDILARTQQREVLSLLRQGSEPDERTVRGYAAALVTLTNHFPVMVDIVAPHAAAVAWRAQVTDRMATAAPVAREGKRSTWDRGSPRSWVTGFVVFVLIRLVFMVFTHDAPRPHADQAAHATHEFRMPKQIYEDEPVTAERIEAIRKGIVYHPGKDVLPGEQDVQFQVVLDADGSVLGLNKMKMPSDPAYAAAVEKAIRATGPFPPKTSKAFKIGYRTVVMRDTDAQPLTPERMAEIRRRIDYRPGKDVPPGEQRVQFEVLLDENGAIRKMRSVVALGDPAYADAVEQAIRSTAPFPPATARSFYIGFHTGKRKSAGNH